MSVVLYSLGAGAAVIGAAIVLPRQYRVERSIDIPATPAEIGRLVAELPERMQWVPWTVTDPDATYTFTGNAGALDSTMSWVGKKIGTATLTLVERTPTQIVTRLDYVKPMKMTSTDRFELVPGPDGQTTVRWINEGTLRLPFGGVMRLMMDKILGADYEQGLSNLRAVFDAPAAHAA
jgi:hypothetical protein